MHDHFAALAALCSPDGAGSGALVLGALFLAGLTGSAAHCAAMCGPFVLAQMGARLQRLPAERLCEQARLREALLLPYHAGRIITYALIGAAAATLGLATQHALQPVLAWLLLGGAALLAAQALARLAPHRFAHLPGPLNALGFLRFRLQSLDVTSPRGALLLGLALGGLPCAFLYAAVAVAASTGGPLGGALAMAAFGLGTVPMLVVVGAAGHQARRLWSGWMTRVAPLLLLGNAAMLTALALRHLAG